VEPIAETVTMIRTSARARAAIFSATRLMWRGELSELPPYFWTTRDSDMAFTGKR